VQETAIRSADENDLPILRDIERATGKRFAEIHASWVAPSISLCGTQAGVR
jgi:hypothetical protein